MVYPDTEETTRFTGTPVLCVEVLSSNRATDLVVKTTRYAALGVDHIPAEPDPKPLSDTPSMRLETHRWPIKV